MQFQLLQVVIKIGLIVVKAVNQHGFGVPMMELIAMYGILLILVLIMLIQQILLIEQNF